jgi:hypothetical protein
MTSLDWPRSIKSEASRAKSAGIGRKTGVRAIAWFRTILAGLLKSPSAGALSGDGMSVYQTRYKRSPRSSFI